MKLHIVLIFLVLLNHFECSKILIMMPSFSRSHIIPLESLAVSLAARKHEITFVTAFPNGKNVENYREIKIPFKESDKEFLKVIARDPKSAGMFGMFSKIIPLTFRITNDTLQSEDLKKLKDQEEFDLVIVGAMFESMLGIADHFKCPSILYSPAASFGMINQALGNPLGASGTPHLLGLVDKMDFLGRLKTFMIYGMEVLMTEFLKYKGRQIYDLNFPSQRYRSFDESLRNVSLALVNYHFSSGVVRPYVPGIVEIGGIQVKPKPDPLPENLKNFLDGAKDGAILFSLGSNAKSTYLAKETIKIILKVFSELNQRVVMKWEADSMEGQPENVFISKWLPQDDVLAHPNIKLFISHCGFGGVVEAKYHGVPIIAVPLFGDQPGNAANIVKEGWAVQVDLGALSEKSFKDAILEVLKNPKYTETVKKMATLARDRPQNAQDTAVFWVEYVLRHRGAPHMHYPGADLNFWQFNSIDVILFLVAVIYMVFKTFKIVAKKMFGLINKKSMKLKLKLS